MKTFLAILLSFITCASLVHAQSDQEGQLGLSSNECNWMRVRTILSDKGPVWKLCVETETSADGCVYKFCNGPGSAGTWEEGKCNKYCITLQEEIPLEGKFNVKSISGDSGVDLLVNYFGLWYKIGATVLGLIGVLVIVISGVQIIFGGASDEIISGAKTRIWAAILSLILLFSSALILQTINPLFFTKF